ncbi:MAG TPA: carboxypeptidase regulatory-like domain-containing protein [Gemmatimonadaceae bacterium]|nr:carboxypeptidase regulatory-like domain-containing protein [Gemmatimonadaceae bacterium]
MSVSTCSCRQALLRAAGIAAVAASVWSNPARAQVVRGTVVDEASGRAMPGIVVVLLDSVGARLGGVLADDAGRYAIRISTPGRYAVRAERIGYRAIAPTPVQVAAGQTVELRLITRPIPIALSAVKVTGKTACVTAAADGREVSEVWDEARKALYATELTQRQELFSAKVMRYERMTDARTGKTTGYVTNEGSGVTRNPFVSLPAAQLSANGFVRQNSTETIYYGPDAGVLLSDEFLKDHCFRLREAGGRRSAMIGLEFEPVRGREQSEISGTLWLDRKTGELRDLEFGYVGLPNLPSTAKSGDFGGRVAFHRMPTGAWIVERWQIRMPVLVDVGPLAAKSQDVVPGVPAAKVERIQLSAIREEGGEVVETLARGERRENVLETSSVTGMVFDSTRMLPVPNARVFLDGTQFAARSDANGRFTIGQVPAGSYTLSVTHPRFDSLQVRAPSTTVAVRGGEIASADLTAPSAATIFARECVPEDRRSPMTALRGHVRDGTTGEPAIEAQVTLTWNRLVSAVAQQSPVVQERVATRTDSAGRYRFCGLPDGVRLTMRVATEERRSAPQTVLLPADAVTVLDLAVGTPAVVASAEPARIEAPVTAVVTPKNQQMRDFDRRRRRGTGTFMSRAQIEKAHAVRLTDLLRSMPGVQVGADENGVVTVELRHAKRFTMEPESTTPLTKADSAGRRVENGNNIVTGQMSIKKCPAAFLLDGLMIDGSSGIDSQLRPEDVEGIEIYSGGQVPIEYGLRHSECGVVMIWTRAAAERSGGQLERDGER